MREPQTRRAFVAMEQRMDRLRRGRQWFTRNTGGGLRMLFLVSTCLAGSILSGCAAITNPTADGIPVRRLPPELLARAKCDEQTIPLNLLRQPPTSVYRLAPGDVLGIFVEGILGERSQLIPLQL